MDADAGDIDALLALAREYRSGSESRPRDLRACFDAYQRAADLGSVEAAHAVALFYMSGGVVPQDLKAGAAHLRAAGEAGHVPAKMYLANMYFLGIHYAKDLEKADVWYRNAARSADIRETPDTPEFQRRMADIGSARDLTLLVDAGALDEATHDNLKRRARIHGLDLKIVEPSAPPRDSRLPDFSELTPATAVPVMRSVRPPNAAPKEQAVAVKPCIKPPRVTPSKWTVFAGLTAFALAALFIVASLALGYGLTLGAMQAGERVPELYRPSILPVSLFVLGYWPQLLWYRIGTLVRATISAAVFAGATWIAVRDGALGTTPLPLALTYASAAGLAFGLLFLGIHGGVRIKKTS